MKYYYIGEVESISKAETIMAKHPSVVITGFNNGNVELSVRTRNERVAEMFRSALVRNVL